MSGQPFPPDAELTAAQRADLELMIPPDGVEPLRERKVGAYFVRNLRRDEVPRAIALFREAMDFHFTDVSWDWRHYARNPGLVHMPAAFDDDGELVGIYPCTIRPAWVNGRDLLTCHACRTLTHPGHRGGGRVFALMSRFTVDRCYSIGVHFGFGGGANEAALKVGSKLIGYKLMHDLEVRERRLSMRLALQARLGGKAGSAASRVADAFSNRDLKRAAGEFEVAVAEEFGGEFDELWQRKRAAYTVLLRRDAREIEWRYGQCPVNTPVLAARRNGVLQGYAAIRHHNYGGEAAQVTQVLDLFTGKDAGVAGALLAEAARQGRAAGSDFLHFAPAAGSVGWELTRRKPWRASRKAHDFVIVRDLCNDWKKVGLVPELETVVDGSNWHYCQGDSDFWD